MGANVHQQLLQVLDTLILHTKGRIRKDVIQEISIIISLYNSTPSYTFINTYNTLEDRHAILKLKRNVFLPLGYQGGSHRSAGGFEQILVPCHESSPRWQNVQHWACKSTTLASQRAGSCSHPAGAVTMTATTCKGSLCGCFTCHRENINSIYNLKTA